MKKPKAPRLITFEFPGGGMLGASKWTWRWVRYGCPNRGEWFMSGAIPEGYKARQHLTTEYHIIEPVEEYVLRQVYVPKSRKDIRGDE